MNEHTYTYSELEKLVASEDPDIDRINLLIDILRVNKNLIRIGLEPTARKDKPIWIIPTSRPSILYSLPSIDISSTRLTSRLTFLLNFPQLPS